MDENNKSDLEDRRQLEHLLPIGFAFLLPYISYGTALFLAGLAVIHALYVSPRLLQVTTRHDEKALGFSVGKLLYAISVMALLIIFPGRIYIVAGVWALLAVGDSLSNIVGRRWGVKKLPYNLEKSWVGLAAFWLSGTLAAWLLIYWNLPPGTHNSLGQLLLFCAISGLLCALAESLPSPIDDNLMIAWVGALSFVLLFSIGNSSLQLSGSWPHALLVNLAAAGLAAVLRWITLKGTTLAFLFGFFVYVAMGWQAYFVLCTFLVLGSFATKLGREHKEVLRVAEGGGGRRGIANVLCNGIIPVLIAAFGLWIKSPPVLAVAFSASVATATLDTVSTEIGKWLGKRPISPLTFRSVKIGTPGGMSWQGTAAGLSAALCVALVSTGIHWLPLAAVPVVTVGALIGSLAESIAASMSKRKIEHSGSTLNIYNTMMGAFVSGLLWLNV